MSQTPGAYLTKLLQLNLPRSALSFDWRYAARSVIYTEKKFYEIGRWIQHCKTFYSRNKFRTVVS